MIHDNPLNNMKGFYSRVNCLFYKENKLLLLLHTTDYLNRLFFFSFFFSISFISLHIMKRDGKNFIGSVALLLLINSCVFVEAGIFLKAKDPVIIQGKNSKQNHIK
jgi:hypothetical protein